MEGSAEVQSPSPEEAAFRRYYDDLLPYVRNPTKFANLLLLEGVVDPDTKERIASNAYEAQRRLVLDSVQSALAQSSDASATLHSARVAMGKSGGRTWPFSQMDKFVKG